MSMGLCHGNSSIAIKSIVFVIKYHKVINIEYNR